ncbi:MAG: methyltransferase domain-containing protein [Dehalococcoidia bacterium]|nr:methyltransferase domain-containing protein [Dehalococcoidia bacterium]
MRSDTDTVEFWNDTWSEAGHTFSHYDQALMDCAGNLEPGRALDLGCGSGGNAVWLAERGWQVTGVDFSEVAIEKARTRAADKQVEVEFVVSDATAYRPDGLYDLITSFYIHLWPEQRARMLANAAEALAPGGRILFVSHDKSSPPSGWIRKDLGSLTTPDEVAAELPSLRIERAQVVEESAAHAECRPGHEETEDHDDHEPGQHSHGATTVVVGGKDETESHIPDRPQMPAGYGVGDPQYGFEPIKWSWVVERMAGARSYWVATTRSDGSPHLSPVWGVWHGDAFHFFTDEDSLKARNIRRDSRAAVHLESGDEVVIMEGTLQSIAAVPELVSAYESKYGISLGDEPEGLYRLELSKALAWLESDFPKTATRWRF